MSYTLRKSGFLQISMKTFVFLIATITFSTCSASRSDVLTQKWIRQAPFLGVLEHHDTSPLGLHLERADRLDLEKPTVLDLESRDVHYNVRSRRQAGTPQVSIVPENVGFDVDLFDLGSAFPGRVFTIAGVSLGDSFSHLFTLHGGSKLRLNSSLSESERNIFDFEVHPIVKVYVNSTTNATSNDIEQLTIELRLTDVNDEPPAFVNQPRPFMAAMVGITQAGTAIYTLTVKDVDANADLKFRISSVTPVGGVNRFELRTARSGGFWEASIITIGNDIFTNSVEYTISVSVEDRNTEIGERGIDGYVKVLVGQRSPQFYASRYTGYIDETFGEPKDNVVTGDNDPLAIRVISFQKKKISYHILYSDNDGGLSRRFRIDDNGQISNDESIDYEMVKTVNLTIEAVESDTKLSNQVDIEIFVRDENDNSPYFLEDFLSKTVAEDTAFGSCILDVTAQDLDSPQNGILEFTVDNENFEMSPPEKLDENTFTSCLKVKRTLEYDNTEDPVYKMQIVVKDRGMPSLSATAQARIYVTNVNDNPPEFDKNSSSVISLLDGAKPGYIVYVFRAYDIDGDQISYSFPSNANTFEIFKIEGNRLVTTKDIPKDKDYYNLTILATDDGSCCTQQLTRMTERNFTVAIDSVNANKPKFIHCDQYDTDTIVREDASIGTQVIQVVAQDDDRGESGRIFYNISNFDNDFPFKIDNNNGNITIIKYINRDLGEFIQVTVTGENRVKGQLLKGWCTFRVRVIEANKFQPEFSKTLYVQDISSSSEPGQIIRQIIATDRDPKTTLTYELSQSSNTFRVDRYTGVVYLENNLQPGSLATYRLTLSVYDNGRFQNKTTNTNFNINVKNETVPSWTRAPADLSPFNLTEDVPLDRVITSFKCRENSGTDNGNVQFVVFNSEKSVDDASKEFRLVENETNGVNLVVSAVLDYEIKKQYQITVVCKNFNSNSADALKILTINVEDVNDKAPRFVGRSPVTGDYEGTIAEDAPKGSTVVTVAANDDDTNPEFRVITFMIDGKNVNQLFEVKTDTINLNRAYIITRSSKSLDREVNATYTIRVTANDTKNTASSLIQVKVTDVNDNAPRFQYNIYRHNVSETALMDSVVFQVTANDTDTVDQERGLDYYFSNGNEAQTFAVRPITGEILVTGKLDYENGPKKYTLTLVAADQFHKHSNSTTVEISVIDENDNRPVFNPPTYDVKDTFEEENNRYSPTNPLPLIQVTATDQDEHSQIVYSFVKPVVNFTINSTSGQIYLTGALDRDGLTPDFILAVKAEDEPENPLTGYTTVTVTPKDIDDNALVFDLPLIGWVQEHSVPGTKVMKVMAKDKDTGPKGEVKYKSGTQETYFQVQSDGTILTGVDSSTQLDIEQQDRYLLPIEAYYNENPNDITEANVTIILLDINDNSPYFEKTEYRIYAAENLEGRIGLIEAYDDDIDPNNRNFQFSLVPKNLHFTVSRQGDAASININKNDPIDFETDGLEFDFTLKVTDGTYQGQTNIKVIITDVNDNAPEFEDSNITVTFPDGTNPGTFIAQFKASDKDQGTNSKIVFSIDRESDPRFEFHIDPLSGNVSARKELDREIEKVMNITIIVTDKGVTPLSSTADLTVILSDINDNAPRFKEDYLPKVEENVANKDTTVVEILAMDPDSRNNGPPFGFKLPDDCSVPACSYFQLQWLKDGDGNQGSALITTSSTFDREKQKQYYLPIVMWDRSDKNSKDSQTATNTLTIVIGDANDNKHKSGHQDIIVQDFEGLMKPFDIGRVYADDPDDWDLPDKTFTFLSPDMMKSYFTIAEDTGMIQMKAGVPANFGTVRDPYQFKVNVYDKRWKNTETCTVSVTVKGLDDQAVWKSGSMRLTGVSAEEFIIKSAKAPQNSKYDKFRQKLASVLGYPDKENVEIVSLIDGKGFLDVRFSAHGSPYLNPAQVESAVMLRQTEFESELGIKIQQLPINLCLDEVYDDGCHTQMNVTGLANTVNANGTTFVGVNIYMFPAAGCIDFIFPEPNKCRGDYCYNGGTCAMDDWGKITCECLPNFDGPRCQQRRHSFNGSSIAFYEAPSICSVGRTSFELITEQEDGIIMVSSSQVFTNEIIPFEDYMIVELENGYPQIHVNLGNGKLTLKLDSFHSSRALKLNDGKWHHIDIDKDGQNVILTVDKCRSGTVENGKLNDSSCSIRGMLPGPDILLNTQGFLQLGGFYNHTRKTANFPPINNMRFSGCIRNFVHNTKLYDLSFKEMPKWNSGLEHCPKEDSVCKPEGNATCGQRSDCASQWKPRLEVVQCTCHPGWYGNKCEQETPIKDFQSESFLKWEFKPEIIEQALREEKIELMFRTRQTTGTLFSMTSIDQTTLLIQLEDSKVTVSYDLEEGPKILTLDNTNASSGQWHSLRVDRFGSEFSIGLDNAEGRKYVYRVRSSNANVIFNSSAFVSAGARVPAERKNSNELTFDLTKTCFTDIRFNGKYLPLDQLENGDEKPASLIQSENIVNDCIRNDCISHICPPGFFCFPLWELYQCRCIAGTYLTTIGSCASLCDLNPCYNGGKCSIQKGNITCSCTGLWEGEFCNVIPIDDETLATNTGLLTGEIAGIIIGILLLLVLLALIIVWVYMHRKIKDKDEKSTEDLYDESFAIENVIYHEEECAGEQDNHGFEMSFLRIPATETLVRPREVPTLERETGRQAPIEKPDGYGYRNPGIGDFINRRLQDDVDKEKDRNKDSLKEYDYEGMDSDAGSLSSLSRSSSSSDIPDFCYLYDLGPKFLDLADLYADL